MPISGKTRGPSTRHRCGYELSEILNQVYDSLYQNAYLARPYKVEPAIAMGDPEKRIFSEEVIEKGVKKKVPRMEYTFHLRDDVYLGQPGPGK